MKKIAFFILAETIFVFSFKGVANTVTSNPGGGNWTTNATWVGNVAPVPGDDVIINGPVTVNNNLISCSNLTINNGKSLTVNSWPLTISGNLSNNGGTINLSNTINIGGNFSNTGTITNVTLSATLNFNGNSSQIISGNAFVINKITINNSSGLLNGVTLNIPVTVNYTLNLTNGIINTDAANILTISQTQTSYPSISGGSATSYVNGPLKLAIPNNATNSFSSQDRTFYFPIGKNTNYRPISITGLLTSGVAGSNYIIAEVFELSTGGTTGDGLSSLNTNRFWRLTPILTTATIEAASVQITESGLNNSNVIAQCQTQNGTYYALTNSSTPAATISCLPSMNLSFGYFVIGTTGTLNSTYYSIGDSRDFPKLYQAVNALNSAIISNDITFELKDDYDGTTGEYFPITFKQPAKKIIIRPTAGLSMRTTSGTASEDSSLIKFNGTDYITLDGRPGGIGTGITDSKWTIKNLRAQSSSTAGPVFEFVNDASNNTIEFLNIMGAVKTGYGLIEFSTAKTGGNGNDFNSVLFNKISNLDDFNLPSNGILSAGSTSSIAIKNSDNTISDNEI
ncbi:MAG: hypothetical protein Q8880_06245, partial [Bacteroidota bacterium]|nr:hypothetical protein [Bacteroidota bacterium]